jgi:hypothetical protein
MAVRSAARRVIQQQRISEAAKLGFQAPKPVSDDVKSNATPGTSLGFHAQSLRNAQTMVK